MRRLERPEIDDLLNLDVVARLATIDAHGFPHVTPIWFCWEDDRFYLTSFATRPHLGRIIRNPKVGLVIDVEDELRPDGERPNRQVRIVGEASVSADSEGMWTRRIRSKYIDGSIAPGAAERAVGRARSLVVITPREITGVASI
ncbi:pyridoxamine 5'-phosphate oxidase family protein [Nocardia sp. NPDC058058]|uniref:pyridoxamine 5'-phosphate oxidase family protein n=1 Tax=Nocardia sp. NPDC058058 TaxID=3346317 RepID=UPI0036DDCCB5